MSDDTGTNTPSNDSDLPESDPAEGAAFSGGTVLDLDIERELQDSYLTYAMSTIMDRALPEVREGLNP
ncbi:MAG: hypothetical protein P1U30_11380, partial [Phycisphaerales bacterium]|nr:hypothetical protein [Phycisphaerales bacterium]